MVFAYTGFRNIIELSGEAKNPRRNIPASLITTILGAIVLYLGLQLAFILGVPQHLLGKGWGGINFDSPFAQLAMLLGMTWLYWILIADSMVSPSGSGIVFTASNARNVFGLAKNRFFPNWLAKVHQGSGVPRRALLLNFVVGILFLLPLPSWHQIIGVTGTLIAFTFSIGSVSVIAFRRSGLSERAARLPGMNVIAPFAFIVSALVIYWVPWKELVLTIPIVVVGLIWYAVTYAIQRHGVGELVGGFWLVAYLVVEYVMGAIGSFGGAHLISSPWDSVVLAVIAAALYLWGTRSGTSYMRARPELIRELREQHADLDAGVAEADAAEPERAGSAGLGRRRDGALPLAEERQERAHRAPVEPGPDIRVDVAEELAVHRAGREDRGGQLLAEVVAVLHQGGHVDVLLDDDRGGLVRRQVDLVPDRAGVPVLHDLHAAQGQPLEVIHPALVEGEVRDAEQPAHRSVPPLGSDRTRPGGRRAGMRAAVRRATLSR